MSSFTDHLIEDLKRSEEEARESGPSRFDTIYSMLRDNDRAMVVFVLVFGPFLFLACGYIIYITPIRIERDVMECIEVFGRRGLIVEERKPIDTARSKISMTYFEFVDAATEVDAIYYTGKPRHYFYFTNEYEDLMYYFVSDTVDLYTESKFIHFLFIATGIVGILVIREIYKEYSQLRKGEVET